jgi:hypothetical protein
MPPPVGAVPSAAANARLLLTTRQILALASGAALVTLLIAVLASWLEYRRHFHWLDPQATTQEHLDRLAKGLEQYHESKGRWPATLAELGELESLHWLNDPRSRRDEWGHELLYLPGPDHPVVRSLGRDGQPGGTGFDHDLTGGEPIADAASASLGDFLREQPSRGMMLTCALAATAVFAFTFLLLWFNPRPRPAVVQVVACTVFATLAAIVMSAVHIPTGVH